MNGNTRTIIGFVVGIIIGAVLTSIVMSLSGSSATTVVEAETAAQEETVAEEAAETTADEESDSAASTETVEPITTVENVHPMGSDEVIDGSSATLTRYDNGASFVIHTSDLSPDVVYTVWWVIFNDPSMCTDNSCGQDDVLMVDEEGAVVVDEDGFEVLNMEQIEATQNSVIGATGTIIAEGGEGHFSGYLGLGDVPGILWGPGLLNPLEAEIHFVLRSHGPADEDLDILNAQIATFGGGCSMAPPGTGMLGDNDCVDEQDAIFMPPQ